MTTRPRAFLEAWRAMRTAFSLASPPPSVKNTRPPSKPETSSRRSASARRGFRAPGGGHEGELVGLRLDGGDEPRVLMAEVAALDQARHVEQLAAALEDELRAAPADDRRGIPVPRHAPAVQHEITLVRHPDILSRLHWPGARHRMGAMKYRQLPATFALFGMAGALALARLRRARAGGRDAARRDAALRGARRAAHRRCRDPDRGRQDRGGGPAKEVAARRRPAARRLRRRHGDRGLPEQSRALHRSEVRGRGGEAGGRTRRGHDGHAEPLRFHDRRRHRLEPRQHRRPARAHRARRGRGPAHPDGGLRALPEGRHPDLPARPAAGRARDAVAAGDGGRGARGACRRTSTPARTPPSCS